MTEFLFLVQVIGKLLQMSLQKIGLGTAAIGRPQYINIRSKEADRFELDSFKKKGLHILEEAYQKGIRYFDTAPGYGIAEQLVLEWLNSKQDSSIEIATKWGYEYVANFDPDAKVHEVKDHSIDQLIKQWGVSKNLLPHLSTLQIHSATFETGVLENNDVLQKLYELKQEYGIRIGLTTTGANQVDVLKKAIDIEIDDSVLFEVFQITYNILDQSLLDIAETLKESNSRIIIKEAMANGRIFPSANYHKYQDLYVTLGELADKYSVGIDAIALQFCIQSIDPFMVLSGASEVEQLEGNLKVGEFELLPVDVEKLKGFGVDASAYWAERKELVWN